MLPTLDSLSAGPELQIYAELTLDVAFTHRGRDPAPQPSDVATVAAFPVASAQVRQWLAANLPTAQLVPANSNAAAAKDVADGRADAGVSTVAGRRPVRAGHAGVRCRRRTQRADALRVGRPAGAAARRAPVPTGRRWCCELDNVPGALVSAMTEFAIRDIDLTRIESRPTRRELGTYMFFLDCVGHIEDDAGRRGTQGASSSLCGCAISGVMADGIGRGGGAAATRRGVPLADADAGEAKSMSGRLVLVRHGQSHGNVERRLDTRPPGAELTDLGREQAATFARDWPHQIGMVAHSVAVRAIADRRRDRRTPRAVRSTSSTASTRSQVGELEDRNDDAAIEEFTDGLPAVARRVISTCGCRRRKRQRGAGPLRPGDHATADALPRRRRVARGHRRGQSRRGDPAGRRDTGRSGSGLRPRPSPQPTPNPLCWRRSPTGGGAVCTGASWRRRSIPEPERSRRSRTPCRRPTRWAERNAQPIASQSMLNACITSGVTQPSSVHSERRSAWWMTVPWQCSTPARHPPALAHGPFIAPTSADPRLPR